MKKLTAEYAIRDGDSKPVSLDLLFTFRRKHLKKCVTSGSEKITVKSAESPF